MLPYPEGQACAEVLLAGEEGGAKAGIVFKGLGLAAGYKFIADGIKLFPSEVHWEIPAYAGSGVGMDVLPALLGVGYICGTKISSYLFAGGIMGWFVPVSYTHLDVYKRQVYHNPGEARRVFGMYDRVREKAAREFMSCLLYTSRCV